jgi:MarR family transcriptional regulator for hemolysin
MQPAPRTRRDGRARAAAPLRAPPGTELGEEIATLFGRARRLMRAQVERELAQGGQQLLDWAVLRYLVRVGPGSQVALADAAAQDPASVSRALEEMERRGLVGRTRDPRDRRRVLVVATAEGRRLFTQMRPPLARGVLGALANLGARELLELRRLLAKAVDPVG